ncbi:hypothetical protein D3C71_2249450 [compost metagenome]
MIHAVDQKIAKIDFVAHVPLNHHLNAWSITGMEDVGPAIAQHVGQIQRQRIVAGASEIDHFH